ncbi:MAG: tetratricopeptide repeat protein [Verrucomicrobia bacterium]|nr:tetratricopeptide repeat protein [Verrucomicrobiota bacterium]
MKHWLSILCGVALTCGVSFAQTDTNAVARDIEWQIKNLGSESRVLRDLAGEKLVRHGAAAREALVGALAGPQRQVAELAAQLLARLPWTEPEDPLPVAEALRRYGEMSAAERQAVGYRLTALPVEKSVPAMLRLISFEPSEAVAWLHAMRLRPWISKCREAILAARMPPRPATWRLLAWAQPERAIERMEQAWATARGRAKNSGDREAGAVCDLVARDLAALYRAQKRWPDVERCWRQLADETGNAGAALELMALAIERGHPKQAEAEWKHYGSLLAGDGRALHLAARALAAQGDRAGGDAVTATALSLHPNDARAHLTAGIYLMGRGWLDAAEKEFLRAVELSASDQEVQLRARFRLADVYGHRGNPAKETEQLETVLHLFEALQQIGRGAEPFADEIKDLRCRLLLLQAKNHAKTGDAAAQEKALREAVKLWPHHPDVLIALHELLRKRGGAAEAGALVGDAAKYYRERIAEQPDEPNLYNNLAWLLANTGRELDEARRFSQKSLELAPDSAAYLDTLAEIHLRLGQPARAVEFQKQAVELEPESLDLVERLKRFEQEAAKSK